MTPEELTTLMTKRAALRKNHPDTVLLFSEDALTYHAYCDDAPVVASLLNIECEPREISTGGFVLCVSFNESQLSDAVHLLVNSKHRVAICEPLEAPKKK